MKGARDCFETPWTFMTQLLFSIIFFPAWHSLMLISDECPECTGRKERWARKE
jgi:hypothetical protein